MKNLTDFQKSLFEKLSSSRKNFSVRWNETQGIAKTIEGDLLSWDEPEKPENVLETIIRKYGTLLGPLNISNNYKLVEVKTTFNNGIRIKACQIFEGIPIYGSTLLVFSEKNRGVYRIQSSFWRDVKITAPKKLEISDIENILHERLTSDPRNKEFEAIWRKTENPDSWAAKHFPLETPPKLYLYPIEEGFHFAYDLTAYQSLNWTGVDGRIKREIVKAVMMIDASKGQVIFEESAKEGMSYTDQNGDGSSTLQDSSNNYITRQLHIVQNGSGNFFLLNRLNTPHIRTYNAAGTEEGLENKLKGDTDLSQDADSHWNTTTTSTTTANRAASQQPETDAHFYAEEAWNFYHSLGWDGFDNGGWGNHCPVRLAAHIGIGANAYFYRWKEWDSNLNAYKHYGYLAFYDGQSSGTDLKFDFFAGDPMIFAHEYQHAITFFAAQKSTGEPGHLYANDWHGAIREGLSDTFAGLRNGRWKIPLFWKEGIIRGSTSYTVKDCDENIVTAKCQPGRRIEYPRSTDTYWGDWYCDHYDDVNTTLSTPCFSRKYFASTLLSHLAYLVGQGGIHQRATRTAQLIPVNSVGLYRTAEIFFYALTNYFDTIPTNQSETTLVEAGELLLAAAEHIGGGKRSCEYVMMRRALYAEGLYPYDESHVKQIYGGEAVMIPWSYDWQYSQPYIGLPMIWFGSPDLFINNNGTAGYDAIIGQENKVYARVRNIGDQAITNIKVRFYFRAYGTNLPPSLTDWMVCKDSAGNACELDIATLGSESMNITDPNNPPAGQAVNWFLDQTLVTPDVDHFCLRAKIQCSAPNNDNDCPAEVQSNVQPVEVNNGDSIFLTFEVANWADNVAPLDIRVKHTLPKGFGVRYVGKTPIKKIMLKYRQTEHIKFKLNAPLKISPLIQPPFDGALVGTVDGKIKGRFEGELNSIKVKPKKILPPEKKILFIDGTIGGAVSKIGNLTGRFSGKLNQQTGSVTGEILCDISPYKGKFKPAIKLKLDGYLEPSRTVNFTQYIKGNLVGGVTVQVKLPR